MHQEDSKSIKLIHFCLLEVIQKIASRIICNEKRDAHAAPLLQKLGLQSLEKRRETKILKTVDNILSNNCHPHLANMFQLDVNGQLANNETTRITFGKKDSLFMLSNITTTSLQVNFQ